MPRPSISQSAGDFDRTILPRYLAGECSAEERAAVEQWIAAVPRRRDAVNELRDLWERAGKLQQRPLAIDVEDAERRAIARIRAHTARQPAPAQRRWLSWRVAAAVLILLGAVLVWRIQRLAEDGNVGSAGPVATYTAPRGQRGHVQLFDGTRLVLAPESRLRVSRDFATGGTRDVQLEGEAFFRVAHDPTRPFRVHAANVTTRVLGTEFSVRAYPDDRTVAVVVKSGRVALQDSVLTRGDLGRVDTAGRTTVTSGVDVDDALAWTEGKLVFKKTPLGEALPGLSRWFNVEFRLGDSTLATRRITASFRTRPGDPMVQALALMFDVRAERRGNVVTFYPRSPRR